MGPQSDTFVKFGSGASIYKAAYINGHILFQFNIGRTNIHTFENNRLLVYGAANEPQQNGTDGAMDKAGRLKRIEATPQVIGEF